MHSSTANTYKVRFVMVHSSTGNTYKADKVKVGVFMSRSTAMLISRQILSIVTWGGGGGGGGGGGT